MDKSVKKKWVAELRSDARKKGVGRLRQGDAYCVLGVLCDVIDPKGWKKHKCFPYSNSYYWLHQGTSSVPSEAVLKAAGLKYNDLQVLISQNDLSEVTFPEMADFIEREY